MPLGLEAKLHTPHSVRHPRAVWSFATSLEAFKILTLEGGFSVSKYDFDDPDIRNMVCTTHTPVERSPNSIIQCEFCGQGWPCTARRELKAWECKYTNIKTDSPSTRYTR